MTKSKFRRMLTLGLVVTCTFNFNINKSLAIIDSKTDLKNSVLEKNKNLDVKNILNTRGKSENSYKDNINKCLKYGSMGLGVVGSMYLFHELSTIVKNYTSKTAIPKKEISPKEIPPFAGLTQSGMNCYINSTLQILYEDPEFRKYINENFNKVTDEDCEKVLDLVQKDINGYYTTHEKDPERRKKLIAELQSKIVNISLHTLHSVFLDMDKNKHGSTVFQTPAKKQFEYSVRHIGESGSAAALFRDIYTIREPETRCGIGSIGSVYELTYSDSNDFDINMYDYSDKKNYKYGDLSEITPNSKSLWLVASMYGELPSSSKTPKQLPMTLELNNSKIYKLKGVSTFTPGHYYGYKTDANGDWWFVDASNCRKEQPDTLSLCTDRTRGVALAYYQEIEQN